MINKKSKLNNIIKKIIFEISTAKMNDDNPLWQDYKKILQSTVINNDTPKYEQNALSINKARRLKDLHRKYADQNWINGLIENIITIHCPVAFSYKKYSSYEECKNEMLLHYPCNIINKNELSTFGIINKDAENLTSEDVLKNFFEGEKGYKFGAEMSNDLYPHPYAFSVYLHFYPRRITGIFTSDAHTSTYKNAQKLTKQLTFQEYQNLNIKEYNDIFFDKINEIDFDDGRLLKLMSLDNEDSFLSKEEKNIKLNNLKRKYSFLRRENIPLELFKNRENTGHRKYSFNQKMLNTERSFYDKDFYKHFYDDSIFDAEDAYSAEQAEFVSKISSINNFDVFDEVVIANYKIYDVWVVKKAINFELFNKWINQQIHRKIPQDLLQIYYRIKYFIECGLTINFV